MGLFGKKSKRGRKKSPLKLSLRKETMLSLVSVFFFAAGGLIFLSFSGQGDILQQFNRFVVAKLGLATFLLPFIFFSAGLTLTQMKWAFARPHTFLGACLIFIGILGLFQSGEVGSQTFLNVANSVQEAGAYLLFFLITFAGYLIITQTSIRELVDIFVDLLPKKSDKPAIKADESGKPEERKGLLSGFSLGGIKMNTGDPKDPNRDKPTSEPEFALDKKKPEVLAPKTDDKEMSDQVLANQPGQEFVWEYPPISLLSVKSGAKADRGDVKKNADIIEQTLDSFGIKAKVVEVNGGPAVTQYAMEISLGTKLTKITALANDLALALAAPTGQIRIEAPIPGRSLVGVEIPNRSSETIGLKAILASEKMRKHKSKLAVALGLDVSGQPVIIDIARMPHCLIAGATGSGKSVCVNVFISSILFRSTPQEVKFILVDPKRVELTGYNGIPHLLTPVIVEPDKVVSALKWATAEMDRRYKTLAEVGVKNIEGYNELAGFQAMPYIVIIIDELADIMLFAPAEVEECITRIAQMARAVGMHLVLATQRPSVDVITGLIKANIPTRIAFNVSSMTDSRVVLDSPGAEKLLGRGDMLYTPPEQSKPTRIQGAFVSEQETRNLIDFIKAQGQEVTYEADITTKFKSNKTGGKTSGGMGNNEMGDKDQFFDEAVKIFSQYDKGSASLIQRRLKVGYARAARILDELHEYGIVGEAEGSKPREVNLEAAQKYLQSLESIGE
ncbi:MAG: DNA translocase FtsK [Patescibacteria group bacterium]